MAEPYLPPPIDQTPECVLCGEPTVGAIKDKLDEASADWPREYACCPACAYGVDDGELYGLLRSASCGPS